MSNAYLTYTFPLLPALNEEEVASGGLNSVYAALFLDRKLNRPQERLFAVTLDSHSVVLDDMNAEIISAAPENLNFVELFDGWFNDWWTYLHPSAFTAKSLPEEVLQAIFKGEYVSEIGTIDRLKEHFSKYSIYNKNPQSEPNVVHRYIEILSQVPEKSTIYWHDHFLIDAILELASTLRQRKCLQVHYHHMAIPEELDSFEKGQRFLMALSNMDTVYVHTDLYKERLVQQFQKLSLPIPQIKRFDLGIDTKHIDEALELVNAKNYTQIPQYSDLTSEQTELIDTVFQSQESVPYRFMDIGRVDAIKGSGLLVDAVDDYLSSLNINIEELRRLYRFFFVWPYKDILFDRSLYNLPVQYRIHCGEKVDRLAKKYPGVVLVASGVPRIFIPSMLRNTTGMTGGVQDGLNLAIEETLYVNGTEGYDVSMIMGIGAGFAMQNYSNNRNLAYYTKVGSVSDIVSAIRDIVEIKTNHPGQLRDKTNKFSDLIRQRSIDILST